MYSLASRRDDSGEAGSAPGRHARRPVDTFDLADLVIVVVSVGFALWTLAFWFALAFGIGWALAGPLWVLGCVAALLWVRRGPGSDRRSAALDLRVPIGSRSAWVVVAGVAASSLTSSWGSGRPAAVAVVVGLVAYGAYQRRSQWRVDRPGAGLGVLGAGAVLGLLGAVELWYPFLAGVAAMVAWLAFAEIRSEAPTAGKGDESDVAGDDGRPPALTLPVVLIGGALAGYLLFTQGYNNDHGHYLNKSLHYAEQPRSFGVRDYMYGVPGVDHIPRGTILNSLEILMGFLSAVTGISHVTLTYHVMAPAAAFLLPVGLAWTAREFGARRPDLVAVMATVSMVMFADTHDSKVVLVRLAEGKLVAGIVALPIFIGAAIRWSRRRDFDSLLLACAAGVATYGLSSTAGIALIPAAGAAMAAGWLASRHRCERTWSPGELARGAVPLVVVVAISGVGFVMHRSIGTGLDRFPDSYSAWLTRLVGRSQELSIDGSEPAVFVLLFAVAIVVLAGRTPVQRWFFGITSGGLLLVVYNPVLFESLWGPLGISGLSWRAAWALPLGLAVGLAVDALHGRDATIWDGRLGAVLVVAVFAIGVSPLAATDQGAPRAFPPKDREAAEALIDATPEGGRFLAPQEVETVAIALTDDRYPTVVRPYFVADLSTYDDLPPAFAPAERMAIYDQLVGGEIGDLFEVVAASAASSDPAELLDRVRVDAVCLPRDRDPRLAQELRGNWTRTSVHARCNVFVRNP